MKIPLVIKPDVPTLMNGRLYPEDMLLEALNKKNLQISGEDKLIFGKDLVRILGGN